MEYAVIRWYNDNKALVLFTGWGAFFMHTARKGNMSSRKQASLADGCPTRLLAFARRF